MNATACKIAFGVLYLVFEFTPLALPEAYFRYLQSRHLIASESEYMESGSAHLNAAFTGFGALLSVVVIVPLFYGLTACSPRQFVVRLLPQRAKASGVLLRIVVLFWLYTIVVTDFIPAATISYWPFVVSSLAGVGAVLLFGVGVDSTRFQAWDFSTK